MPDLAKLRALERAATPAPWNVYCDAQAAEAKDGFGWELENVPSDNFDDCTYYGEADARLMAEARNALPLLLDVADAARVLLDHLLVGGYITDSTVRLRLALRALDA